MVKSMDKNKHVLAIREILRQLGEDPTREGLVDTPSRYLSALQSWTSGYGKKPGEVLKTFVDGSEDCDDQMVFQGSIPFFSNCEHHLASFFGFVHLAYIPRGRVVGLSKLTRLVEIYSRRLTIQERITQQVANALMKHLKVKGAGVVLQARHLCMESRGVNKVGIITVTSALRGCMKNEPACRAEFMSFVTAVSSGGLKSL